MSPPALVTKHNRRPWWVIVVSVTWTLLAIALIATSWPLPHVENHWVEPWVAFGTWALVGGTLFLGFFTFRLWSETQATVLDGRKHAERGLRAYALVSEGIYGKPSEQWRTADVMEISVKNFGKTPARDFRIQWTARINPEVAQVPLKDWSGRTEPAILAPDDKEMFDVELKGFDEERMKIAATKVLYEVIGTATYSDVFGATHTTEFNLYMSWNAPRFRVWRHPTGNDAD